MYNPDMIGRGDNEEIWYPAAEDDDSAGRIQSGRYEDGQMDVYSKHAMNSFSV